VERDNRRIDLPDDRGEAIRIANGEEDRRSKPRNTIERLPVAEARHSQQGKSSGLRSRRVRRPGAVAFEHRANPDTSSMRGTSARRT
jgi:hypothetical protein